MKECDIMTDNELLLSISDMMDKKLDIRLSPIENQLHRVENDLLEGNVLPRLNTIEDRLHRIEVDILEDNVLPRINTMESQLHRIEVDILENNVLPRLNTIESCYMDTYNRYKDYADKMESVFDDVGLLKEVVVEHSEKLQRISY